MICIVCILQKRAVELGIKIVTLDWVKAVWDTNIKESISAVDSTFEKFRCPVFLNLVVTSTSLNKREKEDIKKLINSNGGVSILFFRFCTVDLFYNLV